MMPNIETLRVSGVELSKGFLRPSPDGPRANAKLLPSLRSLHLANVTLNNGDWGHLMTYLTHQISDGQLISLKIIGEFPHLCTEVAKEVKDLVGEFICYPFSKSVPLVVAREDSGIRIA